MLACLLAAAEWQTAIAQTSTEQTAPAPTAPASAAAVATLAPMLIEEIRFPATVNFPQIARGIAAFEANRKLAPDAKLSFSFVDLTAYATPLKIRRESGDTSVLLEPDSDGNLNLEDPSSLGDKDAALVMNRRMGEVRVQPHVLSPGTSPTLLRMGDLRLLCEVTWGMQKSEVSATVRGLYWMLGGPCKSKNSALNIQTAKNTRAQEVEIAQGQRTQRLQPNAARNAFSVPIHDRSWGDDAIVRTKLEEMPTPPQTETETQPSM